MFYVLAAQAPDRQGSQSMKEDDICTFIRRETASLNQAGRDSSSIHLYNVSNDCLSFSSRILSAM